MNHTTVSYISLSPAQPKVACSAGFTVLASPRHRSGAFLRPAGGSCNVENLNSSVYVYHANLQLQQSHTSVTESVGNDVLVLPRIAHIFEENSY